jgi:hypothetical protein
MDSQFKPFRNSIHMIHTSIFLIFLFTFFLITTPSKVMVNYITNVIFSLFGIVLCIVMIIWGIRKFRQRRLPFKQNRRTKALTYTALTASIVSFTLLGITVVFRFCNYYAFNLAISLVLGVVGFVVASVMYEDFLPEQVVAEYIVESQAIAP